MDTNLQDPDDPAANSDMEMVEILEMVEKELHVENLAPDELPLENVLMEEVAKHRQQLNHGDLSNERQVDPGYDLLPAPVSNIKKLWRKKGPLRGFLNKKDKRTVSDWVRLTDIDPVDFWPLINGKHATEQSIAVSMFFGLIDTKKNMSRL